ncbi:hypothetical protein, partial [Ursidibacter arcticus]|uniref:hypothetical protein n=1 Tax=Ursidibacter arcticus TaxID=1524965 RepID=UPI0012FCCD6B
MFNKSKLSLAVLLGLGAFSAQPQSALATSYSCPPSGSSLEGISPETIAMCGTLKGDKGETG